MIIVALVVVGVVIFTNGGDDTNTNNANTSNANGATEDDDAMMEDKNTNEVMEEETGETKTFTLTGEPYTFSQDEIRVNVGDTVTINFSSTEGNHDWVLDEFNAATDEVSEGESDSVTFVADQAGTFEFYCSVEDHRANGMVGTLIVE